MAIASEKIDEAKAEEARQRAAARLHEKLSSEEHASVNAALTRSLAQLRVKRRHRADLQPGILVAEGEHWLLTRRPLPTVWGTDRTNGKLHKLMIRIARYALSPHRKLRFDACARSAERSDGNQRCGWA